MVKRIVFLICLGLVLSAPAHGAVKISDEKILTLDEKPLDTVTSRDGRRIFVLTEKGNLLVYTSDGVLEERLAVGRSFDGLRTGPGEETLILKSQKENLVKIIALSFRRKINTTGSPFKGPADAPVEIIVFSDFQCPYCARLVPLLDQVLREYKGKVKIVFKNYPLRSHPFALDAAVTAMAANRQGKFWEFHDLLFENHSRLNLQKIKDISVELKLNQEEMQADMKSPEILAAIKQDVIDADRAGVRGAPAVFVDGWPLKNRTLKSFREAIEKALPRGAQAYDSKED